MSASLVGSGDVYKRQGGGRPTWRGRGKGLATRFTRTLQEKGRGGAAKAVSYTHLTLPTICSV
eukprot:8739627-Alexandrium_andersonii.AAC.1